jgi:hypothetical protein
MDMPVLVDSCMDAAINAPGDTIDLSEWMFGLTDEEYQECSRTSVAAERLGGDS